MCVQNNRMLHFRPESVSDTQIAMPAQQTYVRSSWKLYKIAGNMMIHYDRFETWEKSFGDMVVRLIGEEAVKHLASSNFEFIEDAGDFVVNHSDCKAASTAIQSWLLAQEICVFHGTRLLPEEILSVQQKGLCPLVAADREQRLREILRRHPRWRSVENRILEVIEDVGPKEKQGRREGQVHFRRVSDLLCMNNLAHASLTKEHDDNDDIQGSFRRAA